MTTKVLNKLVNICTTLSGGEVSSGGTSSEVSSGTSSGLTKDEIIDLICPVGCVITLKDDSSSLTAGTPGATYAGTTWTQLDSFDITPILGDAVSVTRWLRKE